MTMTATPMRNGGARRGFEFMDEQAVRVGRGESLARALTYALSIAE